MNFKKLFLPVGLVVAVLLAFAIPEPGIWMKSNGLVPYFIVMIFLVNGWQLKFKESKLDKAFAGTFVTGMVISLFIGPLLGAGVVRILPFEVMLGLGLIVMAAVPPTLSSGIVITEVAGGNALWALFMTVGFNLLGIFTVPFMLPLCLKEVDGISVSPGTLLVKLVVLVLLPFAGGVILRKIVRKSLPSIAGYIPSTCVILTVLASFSASRAMLVAFPLLKLPLLLAAVVTVHLILFVIANCAGRLLKLRSDENKALTFVSSQKTLPIALSVLSALGGNTGVALMSCLLFHFAQLLLDSFIAARWGQKAEI